MATPTNVHAAPRPTTNPALETCPNRPTSSPPIPNRPISEPTITLRRIDELGAEVSRNASTGATREARRAGDTAAATVIPVPRISDTMIVRGAMTRAVGGSFNPSAPIRAFSPIASSIPSRMPPIDATRPTTTDSRRTDDITCRRVAPRARNRASSRLRWVTTMLNVLKMMNAPTNSATNPNTNRPVRRNPRPWFTWSCCWLAAEAPVTAWYPLGRTVETRAASWSGSTALLPAT